jgi:zinc transport system substrate-binding protein
MKRTAIITLILVTASLWAGGKTEDKKDYPVISTTSWTAAFANLAGVETTVLAPYEMQHPSEYELKPSDIARIGDAKLIVFAGYENMVQKIKDNAGSEETKMVQITTVMNSVTMEESVMKIAEASGTEEIAQKNLKKMKELLENSRTQLKESGLYGQKAVVHMYQKAFAQEMGFDVIATYGPQPLSAAQIGEIAGLEPALIIDNWHNPVSQPLKELLPQAQAVEWINFPGKDGTETLFDVVEYNMEQTDKM